MLLSLRRVSKSKSHCSLIVSRDFCQEACQKGVHGYWEGEHYFPAVGQNTTRHLKRFFLFPSWLDDDFIVGSHVNGSSIVASSGLF